MSRRVPDRARVRIAAVLLMLLTVSPHAAGDDWPHLRGPRYDGTSAETGLADSWGENGPTVLWRIPLGQGYSALVVAGQRVYTQTQDLGGQYVVCLDAPTGREVWRYRYGWPWSPESEWPGPRATPTFSEGRVYFAGAYGLVGCLDAATGRRLWSLNVKETFGSVGTEFGYACSPLVMNGKVYLPVGGTGAAMVALRADDGSLVWRSGDFAASYSSALPVTVAGRTQIVAFLRNDLAAFDPETGELLWQVRWSEGYDEHSSSPVYREPYLLSMSAFRLGARCLRLDAGTEGPRAELAWESKILSNDVLSSIVVGECVYGFDLHDMQPRGAKAAGEFRCIDLATGRLRWSTDRTRHTSVIAADGKLILLNDVGELILARATPGQYDELARAQVLPGGVCWTQPTLSCGRLFARNQHEAVCVWLGASTPPEGGRVVPERELHRVQLWQVLVPGSSRTVPTVMDLVRWYIDCMVLLVGSGLLSLAYYAVMKRFRPARVMRDARVVFFGYAFLTGAMGTLLLSMKLYRLVFTWPLALFVACFLAVATVVAENTRRVRQDARAARRATGRSPAALVFFAAACLVYYWACRRLFIISGFGFFVGLFPGALVASVASRRMNRRQHPLRDLAWTALSFTVFFCVSALFTFWRMRL
ncbi:MAG TPA: PQQ-binding-like beta-propeller repeat protein [Planctomycetota bacterium]|nr:PQQ-binding-like beta-propeller repeat protein [Planctomycetota bacterium]